MKMNRKGDLPTFMMFLVAFVLVTSALFSFVSFKDSFMENGQERDEILNEMSFYEEYIIKDIEIISRKVIERGGIIEESKLKEEFIKEFSRRNYEIAGLENYYGKLLRGEFEFSRDETKYSFEIQDFKIKIERGANSIERKMDLAIEFDYSGDVLNS